MKSRINRPNIVVVICHDLGKHLKCYGVEDVRSPNIDSFAETGVLFENFFCTAPQCSPSRASLWTGRFPHANGVIGLTHGEFGSDLNPDEIHLAQILRDNGYKTHLFGIQHEANTPERCGHEFIHSYGSKNGKYSHASGDICSKIAEEFIECFDQKSSGDEPFFAEVNFFEPHRPFRHEGVQTLPPESLNIPAYLPDIPEVREDLSQMEASIATADAAFGRIARAINSSSVADNTIIVFTADHGVALPGAKFTLKDPGIEISFLLSGPGIPIGKKYKEMISNVDIMPTLLDIVGIQKASNIHGKSFKSLIDGNSYMKNEFIFAEKTFFLYYDPMRAVRSERWKLIANFESAPSQEVPPDYDGDGKSYVEVAKKLQLDPSLLYHPAFELYDLKNDPWETNNLANEQQYQEIRDELIRTLRGWMKDTCDPLLKGPVASATYRNRIVHFNNL